MFKLKGLYEWKLINKDTQKIDQQGEQWNVISDVFYTWMVKSTNSTSYCYDGYTSSMGILLSDSVATPGVDYRRRGKSHFFNVIASGTALGGRVNWDLKSKDCEHYFTPSASPRTIRIIGIKLFSSDRGGLDGADNVVYSNFVSFVELSTPITQNTDQYLNVKYTVFCSYTSSIGYGTPATRYTDFFMNQCLYTPYFNNLGSVRGVAVGLTSFLPPSNINNVLRSVATISNFSTSDVTAWNPLSTSYSKNYSTTDLLGPIGVVAFQQFGSGTINTQNYFLCNLYGHSQTKDLAPSIARIFLHTGTRDAYLFSDPTASPPPASRGTVSATGTPTNKYPVIARVRITKTGDASDLVDETVAYTAVDTGNSQITISQDFTTEDIYQISSTDTLPSPLVAGTSYYIIRIDSTHIRLANSSANALAGVYITLTTQGAGNHTLVRQNTGKYRLELEPYNTAAYGIQFLSQLPMGIDYDGYIMPAVLSSTSTNANALAEGDYASGTTYFREGKDQYLLGTNSMLRGCTKNGDYIYSVQQSRKGLIHNICRWLFNTIETSQPLCKFGNGSTIVRSTLDTATKMYIVTNDGIYEYTYATPTVAPVLLTITGLIDNVISDACIDPVTGYMWTGHTTGLSRINLSTLTATQYIGGTGGALEGLGTADLNIYLGQLDAYNGRVLRGYTNFGDSTYQGVSVNAVAWVMDDGIGWYRVSGTTACYGGCIRKGTNQVVWKSQSNLVLYDVTVTGKGVGSSTAIESYALATGTQHTVCNLIQMSSTRFIHMYVDGTISYNAHFVHYKIGAAPSDSGMYNTNSNWGRYMSASGWACCTRRNPIDIDGNGNNMYIFHNWFISAGFPSPTPYGWNGSAWEKDNANSRNIPKTTPHSLVNGVSVNFNNATGSAWDLQFVVDESYSICHGPYRIKDNLQTLQIKCKNYTCATYVVEAYSANVGAAAPYIISIPEKSDPNFRDMDIEGYLTEVSQGATVFTPYAAVARTVTYTLATSIVNTGTGSIPTGTPVVVYGEIVPYPLENSLTYYAINVNTTSIRLANTYSDAMAGTYITLGGWVQGTQYLYPITPTAGTYIGTGSGDFIFNSADAGKTMTLTYTYTKFST